MLCVVSDKGVLALRDGLLALKATCMLLVESTAASIWR